MITGHSDTHLTLFDGEREHTVAHADFDWMRPHGTGGIHPAVTEQHQTWLHIPAHLADRPWPVAPVTREHPHLTQAGGTVTATYLPINAYLQAKYGPDDQIVTVPINGDAAAQRLHWLKRTDAERVEMRAVLEALHPTLRIMQEDGTVVIVPGAWRLTDNGEMP